MVSWKNELMTKETFVEGMLLPQPNNSSEKSILQIEFLKKYYFTDNA